MLYNRLRFLSLSAIYCTGQKKAKCKNFTFDNKKLFSLLDAVVELKWGRKNARKM